MSGFGISGSASKSSWNQQSETNPWAAQDPYLRWAFEQAKNLAVGPGSQFGGAYWTDPNRMQLQANQAGYENAMGQMSDIGQSYVDQGLQYMPDFGKARQYQQDVLAGNRGQVRNPYETDQYNDMLSDYWSPAYQAADQANLTAGIEALRRSDYGDALGASLAGQGVGPTSSEYLQARNLQAENMMDAYQQNNANLQMDALGAARQRANQWANTDVQTQFNRNAAEAGAAGQLAGYGQYGNQLMNQGVGLQQGAYQAGLGYGQNQWGWDEMARQGQYNQWMDRWAPLNNFWNIVGAGSWGSQSTASGSQKSMEGSAGFGI